MHCTSRGTTEKESEMNNDLQLNNIDTLGSLLAQIADLTKQADAIKDAIKEAGADGKLETETVNGKPVHFVNGALFRATYIESNVETFDKAKFVKTFGEDVYKNFTKIGARFTVKVTSK
jgi:hypothetical protein